MRVFSGIGLINIFFSKKTGESIFDVSCFFVLIQKY